MHGKFQGKVIRALSLIALGERSGLKKRVEEMARRKKT